MDAHLSKALFVEAAHRNPAGNTAQQRLHGHTYRIELLATGPVEEESGWVVDFGDLRDLFGAVLEQVDHSYLNDLPGMGANACLADLEAWIMHAAEPPKDVPWRVGVRVSIVGDLFFTPHRLPAKPSEGLPERLRFSFEAAQSLPRLPKTHPCRNLHGHSYHLEVAAPDLDILQRHLNDLYDLLDHGYLNEIEGLEHATSEAIGHWVWQWLEARKVRPTAVVVQETLTARCLFKAE
jgi:6-pyruvoyltetrahydropterin/6-carboxytetrahydropterin synthase